MIAEVETDKATMEVECFEDGVLIKQYCKEGEEVPVGGSIAAIGETGEAAPAVEAPAENTSSAPSTSEPATTTNAPTEPVVEVPVSEPSEADVPVSSTRGDRVKASPLARKIAESKGIDPNIRQSDNENNKILQFLFKRKLHQMG